MRLPFIILSLGWLAKQWTLSRGQDSKPSISMIPNREIFFGEQLSIYCGSLYPQSQIFQLWHEDNQQVSNMKAIAVNRGIFTILSAQQAHAGKYSCWYCFSSRCSPRSDHIYLNITELVYQKPSISVNPSEVVTLGERVTIYCKSEGFQNAEFTLQKYKSLDTYGTMKTKTGEIQFPMVTVESSDAGIYRCRYCLKAESAFYQRCSNYSDRVSINVTGYWFPKPFIQMIPSEEISPGSNVTIECQGPRNDLTFFLLKSNKAAVSKKTGEGKNSTKFHISRVTSEDEGTYACHYSRTNECLWSVPSDPVELLLTAGTPPSKDSEHAWCQGPENGLIFSLQKSKDLVASQTAKPDRNTMGLPLFLVRVEDARIYTCQSCHKRSPSVCSEPSEPVELAVTGHASLYFAPMEVWSRLGVGIVVVLVLMLILAEAIYSWRTEQHFKNIN